MAVDNICPTLASENLSNATGLSLAGPEAPYFVEKAQAVINDLIKTPIESQVDPDSYLHGPHWDHANFNFSIGGTSLCQFYARVSVSSERTLVKGLIPTNIPTNTIDQTVWDKSDKLTDNRIDEIAKILALGGGSSLDSLEKIIGSKSFVSTSNQIATNVDTIPTNQNVETETTTISVGNGSISSTSTNVYENKCLFYDPNVDKTKLLAAWEVRFNYNNLPYYGLVVYNPTPENPDNQIIYKAAPSYFSDTTAPAITTTYQKVPLSSTNLVLTNLKLNGLSKGGSLCSTRFRIVVDNPPTNTSLNVATVNNAEFNFKPNDYHFNQASVFTNATLHSNWFLQEGSGILKSWPSPRVQLKLDYTNMGVNNSAVYIPPDKNTGAGPYIKLGNGDGVILQNLQIDSDAVSHEAGHHVVYQTLKTTSGDSLIIHEGLADFFVMARTKSPCLGNLICPRGGTLCISAQCLRSSNNNWSFLDPNMPTEPHQQSQFISGMLWSIGKKIGLDTAARDTLKAIEFFPISAGFPDLVQSLMEADKILHKGTNACAIQAEAYARGLKEEMTSASVPDCKKY